MCLNTFVLLILQDFPFKDEKLNNKTYTEHNTKITWRARIFFNNELSYSS